MDDYGEEQKEEIEKILGEFESLNTVPGPIIQKVLRFKADTLVGDNDNEQHLIHLLVESHMPTLRIKTELELESNELEANTNGTVFNKQHLQFSTSHPLSNDKRDLDLMVHRIAEMPKEWTVLQITPYFSCDEVFGKESLSTNGIHITVFNCGCKNEEPYCVSLEKNHPLSSREDMKNIKSKLKTVLSLPLEERKKSNTLSSKQLRAYHKQKAEIVNLLEAVVYDMETAWLGPWKCLFIGKYTDMSLELRIRNLITRFLEERSLKKVSKKIENILVQAVKGAHTEYTVKSDIKTILEYCFPGKKLRNAWTTFWEKHEIVTGNEERHPVILIVDETLDSLPWEMISTLNKHPCSRMPSLHLLYAIFKAHEDTIVDGYKIIPKYTNGKYILNPGLDLPKMEIRLKNFFQYWLPEWNGIAGRAPKSEEFRDMLTNADIFCYSGHGSGSQYCSSEKIKKDKINAVVFLFGCGSTQLVEMGPEVEMYWTSQMYLLAACPCLIGMLWVVTDLDTDSLTSKFLSFWIPNSKKDHWQLVDHNEWQQSGTVKLEENVNRVDQAIIREPDLLKALCAAKDLMKSLFNKAAVVVRGIPIKLMDEEQS